MMTDNYMDAHIKGPIHAPGTMRLVI